MITSKVETILIKFIIRLKEERLFLLLNVRIGGFRRGQGRIRSNFPYCYKQYLGNFGRIICWRSPPPLRICVPRLGNHGSATELKYTQKYFPETSLNLILIYADPFAISNHQVVNDFGNRKLSL